MCVGGEGEEGVRGGVGLPYSLEVLSDSAVWQVRGGRGV